MTNNYRQIIQEQRERIRDLRMTEARNKYYGTNHKSSAQIKQEEKEYARLEREFWSN